MKKLIFKIVFKFGIIIAVLMSVPYFMMGGRLPDWAISLIPFNTDKPDLPSNISSAVTDQEVTYYQWVDEHGQTHYSNTPPAGMAAEQKMLRPDTNIVQAIKVPEPEESSQEGGRVFSLGSSGKSKSGKDDKSGGGEGESLNPYSPDGIKNLVEQAQNAAKAMDNHNKQLGKLSGSSSE